MAEGRVEQVREQLIGLRPVYSERGNATELWLLSGEVLIDRRGVKSVLAALARSYTLDLKAQREKLGQLLKRSLILPFHLGERVFIPLKLRKALTTNDLVYGYFDCDYIKDIQGEKLRECRVFLKTGDGLECCSSEATAKNSWRKGRELKDALNLAKGEDMNERRVLEAASYIYRCFRDILLKLEDIEYSLAESESIYQQEGRFK